MLPSPPELHWSIWFIASGFDWSNWVFCDNYPIILADTPVSPRPPSSCQPWRTCRTCWQKSSSLSPECYREIFDIDHHVTPSELWFFAGNGWSCSWQPGLSYIMHHISFSWKLLVIVYSFPFSSNKKTIPWVQFNSKNFQIYYHRKKIKPRPYSRGPVERSSRSRPWQTRNHWEQGALLLKHGLDQIPFINRY